MPTFHTPTPWVNQEIVTYSKMEEEVNDQVLALHAEAATQYYVGSWALRQDNSSVAITVDDADHLMHAAAPQPWILDHTLADASDPDRTLSWRYLQWVYLTALNGCTAFTVYPYMHLENDWSGGASPGLRELGDEQTLNTPTTSVWYIFNFGWQSPIASSGVATWYPAYRVGYTGGAPTVGILITAVQVRATN